MRKPLFFLAFLLWLPASLSAARWLENDYTFGSNGMKKDTLSVFSGVSQRVNAGLQATYYRDNISFDKIYSFRLPLMFSGRSEFVSFTPFLYPVAAKTRSGAYGGKIDLVTSLTDPDDNNYLHLTLSGSWARQRAMLAGAADKKEFTESALQLQIEKSFYKQFIFLVSGAGFAKPSGVSNATLVTPPGPRRHGLHRHLRPGDGAAGMDNERADGPQHEAGIQQLSLRGI